jgi:MFS family permease
MKLSRNRSWDNWGTCGYVFGIILIILGVIIQVLEFPRIYNGPTNEGDGLYLISNYYNHWWPWTYAASIFGLVTLLTGFMGVLAGNRRSYGSILGFFIMCLLSALFAIYLIVYFSFIIAFYRSMNLDKSNVRTQAQSVAYGIAGAQLALACVNVIISFLGAFFSGRAIAICLPKGVFYDDVQPVPYRPYANRY